jgi:hypothetical protein
METDTNISPIVAFNAKVFDFGYPIIIAQTGSRAYGLETETSDWDYRGVFIPKNEYIIGLKTVEQIKVLEDCWVCHSLEHYVEKMIGQNPTLLELLFVDSYMYTHPIWNELLPELRKLVYAHAFKPYSAYVLSQLNKARFRHPTMKRYELIQEHGYDTKFMSHVARLAVQCTFLMRDGYIPVKVPEPFRSEIMQIKLGLMDKHEALLYCEDLDKKMHEAYTQTKLPKSIDINKFEREVYMPLMKRIINSNE